VKLKVALGTVIIHKRHNLAGLVKVVSILAEGVCRSIHAPEVNFFALGVLLGRVLLVVVHCPQVVLLQLLAEPLPADVMRQAVVIISAAALKLTTPVEFAVVLEQMFVVLAVLFLQIMGIIVLVHLLLQTLVGKPMRVARELFNAMALAQALRVALLLTLPVTVVPVPVLPLLQTLVDKLMQEALEQFSAMVPAQALRVVLPQTLPVTVILALVLLLVLMLAVKLTQVVLVQSSVMAVVQALRVALRQILLVTAIPVVEILV
jgi:hypothetical protein